MGYTSRTLVMQVEGGGREQTPSPLKQKEQAESCCSQSLVEAIREGWGMQELPTLQVELSMEVAPPLNRSQQPTAPDSI